MPNLDPWINQNSNNEEHMAIKTINKFENHLLAIRDECQKMIRHNSHPAYNAHHQKIIEIINWVLDK